MVGMTTQANSQCHKSGMWCAQVYNQFPYIVRLEL